jgi:predicted amidohydrolase YtcJ
VIDPGGFNMAPRDYLPLFRVWQDHELTVRVAYSLFAQRRGAELEDFQSLTQLLPMGFGDDLLRFNGIGESVTWAMYNNDNPTEADKAKLAEVARWAAERRMALTIHWSNEKSVGHLLEVFERVNRDVPIGGLRWSIAHLNDATPATLDRMKALGVGWLMQDAMYFSGETFIKERGAEAARRTPPIGTGMRIGVPIGAGTDAHRVMSYNPFAALQWMLDGKTIGGTPMRGPEETPTREEGLRLYTLGSAWFAFDEGRRGSLEVGRLADLAVLSEDYLSVPVEKVGRIESLLTMVGGRVVYAVGAFQALEERRPTR